jgi:hypothetical protein
MDLAAIQRKRAADMAIGPGTASRNAPLAKPPLCRKREAVGCRKDIARNLVPPATQTAKQHALTAASTTSTAMSNDDLQRKAMETAYRAQLDLVHDLMRLHAGAALAATSGNVNCAAGILFDRLEADANYQKAYENLNRLESDLAKLEAYPSRPSRNPKRRKA